MRCKVIYAGIEHEAYIRDISLSGASLWQTFMPPRGSNVSIKLEEPSSKTQLILEGRVARTDCKTTDRGMTGAFAVQFSISSPEFVRLIGKLSKETQLKPMKGVGRRNR